MAVKSTQNQLPQLPIDPNDFIGLRNYLVALGERMATLGGDATPPALVTNVILDPIYPGVYIRWDAAAKADGYLIFRNTTGDFATATPIRQLMGGANVSYFDATTDIEDGVNVFYWVQAFNLLGVDGPVSAMVTGVNSSPPSPPTPGGIIGDLEAALFANASPDDDLPSMQALLVGISDITTDATFWSGITEDEDFMVSAEFLSGGYSLP